MHINRRVIDLHRPCADGTTIEDVVAAYPIGEISMRAGCPFVYKVVENNVVDEGNGWFRCSLVVEPASPDEAGKYLEWDWSKDADRESQARWTASSLRQTSWYSGIPDGTKIFCDAHQKMMSAHGSNRYDNSLVCTQCVEYLEIDIASNKVTDPQAWISERAEAFKIVNLIDEIERTGQGVIQIGERYLEIFVLWDFIRNSEYKDEARIEEHYPYKDMIPSAYRGYLRENWRPGDYFNAPIKIIIFTSRNKLMDFISSGGKIPDTNIEEDDDFPLDADLSDLLNGEEEEL